MCTHVCDKTFKWFKIQKTQKVYKIFFFFCLPQSLLSLLKAVKTMLLISFKGVFLGISRNTIYTLLAQLNHTTVITEKKRKIKFFLVECISALKRIAVVFQRKGEEYVIRWQLVVFA